MGPNDKFDLLIRGGEVLDPSQKLRGGARHRHPQRRHRGGRSRHSRRRARTACSNAEASSSCPAWSTCTRTSSPTARRSASRPTSWCRTRAPPPRSRRATRARTTSPPSAAPSSRTRARASTPSCTSPTSARRLPGAELYNIDYARAEARPRVAENADLVIGIKVRMSENVIARHGLEPLKRAIRACEISRVAGAKVMCHIGGVETPGSCRRSSTLLRAKDILTHCYSGAPNIARSSPTSCRTASSCPPRSTRSAAACCSTSATAADLRLHRGRSGDRGAPARHDLLRHPRLLRQLAGMPYLTWVMSKFLNMGFSLEQVVAMATVIPARAIKLPKLGTLQAGRPATSPCSRWSRGRWSSSTRATTSAPARCTSGPSAVAGGVAFGRPYQAPFSVR